MYITLKNGIKLYYEEYGKEDGYPLLFLHGNSESLEIFNYFFDKLNNYRLIFVDSRCHGKSSFGPLHFNLMAEDIELLIEELRLERLSIIGFSDGGIISILLSMKLKKIDKIFSIGPNLNPLGLKYDAINQMKIDYEVSHSIYTKLDLEEPNIDPIELKDVQTRAIIIRGENDCIKEEHIDLINKSFNNSTLYVIKDSSHMVPIDKPDKLLEIIENELSLDIYYEDNHVIVVDKKVGILSQEDSSKEPDLMAITKRYLKIKYDKPGNVYLGLIQRLDRNVSGLMILSKTTKATTRLNASRPKKHYLAVAHGEFKTKEDTLVDYIEKDEDKRIAFSSDKGKIAILRYKVLNYKNDLSLVDVFIETGRFHQIRYQLSKIGHPLYNDSKYGKSDDDKDYGIGLDAYKVEFLHPITSSLITIERYPKRQIFSNFDNEKSD